MVQTGLPIGDRSRLRGQNYFPYAAWNEHPDGIYTVTKAGH